jgi:hypothetical protein
MTKERFTLASQNTMRSRIRRHISSLLSPSFDVDQITKSLSALKDGTSFIPSEFTPHQYVILLLYIAAEVEHALMVQYLYAGFSLGGTHVPVEYRARVMQWQERILGIAKEEMGHLMTVQNLLRCLGGPLNLDREDYPWDSELYPFPFQLEPLTRQSLAKYVYTESPAPEQWTGNEANEIRDLAQKEVGGAALHRVGALYAHIQALFENHDVVKDADFRSSTYPFQANWDEWGRGYQGGARGNATGGAMPGTPNVILMPVTSRSDAVAALKAVATQGEANPTADDTAPSHFARFLRIFREFPKNETWSPSRKVPVNPIVVTKLGEEGDNPTWGGTPITHLEGRTWGHLFNVRYQILLTSLLHTFEYPSNLSETSQKTPRGLLLHATFGEMYNLRALSQILVQTPLTDGESNLMAGPPFQMPYTLKLPIDSADRWRLHLDLLETSKMLADSLLRLNPDGHSTYLLALKGVDRQTTVMIEAILGGHPTPKPAMKRQHQLQRES